MRPTIPVLIALFVSCATTVWADPLDDAFAAYRAEDYATTLAILTPLSEAGDPEADDLLSVLYENGSGVAKDVARALALRTRAAEAGVVGAQLGSSLYPPADDDVVWLKRAAHQGETVAMLGLGSLYEHGDEHTAADPEESLYWYEVARAMETELLRIRLLDQPTAEEKQWLADQEAVNSISLGSREPSPIMRHPHRPDPSLSAEQIAAVQARVAAFRPVLERQPR